MTDFELIVKENIDASGLEYLGEKVSSRLSGSEWTHPHIRCVADSIDNQIHCSRYSPCKTLWCRYCECGDSDICTIPKDAEILILIVP